MKALCTLLLLTLPALSVQAALPNNAPIKIITPLVKQYLKATTCSDDTLDPKLVTRFVDKTNKVDGYVAMMSADLHCAGGSGTSSPAIVVLRISELRAEGDATDLKVDTAMSEPTAVSKSLSRALTSLYQKDGQLFATGLEYGKDDANCCPSLKTIYRVNLVGKTVNVAKDDNRTLYTWEFRKMN